jgi:hypothetical protein
MGIAGIAGLLHRALYSCDVGNISSVSVSIVAGTCIIPFGTRHSNNRGYQYKAYNHQTFHTVLFLSDVNLNKEVKYTILARR